MTTEDYRAMMDHYFTDMRPSLSYNIAKNGMAGRGTDGMFFDNMKRILAIIESANIQRIMWNM